MRSQAHQALKKVVLIKKLVNDISHLTLFCHTRNLEAYHAMLTKYCQKREHFSYKGMAERLQLAVLDQNMNLQSFWLLISKKSSDSNWCIKNLRKKGLLDQYMRKQYSYIHDLMQNAVSLTQSENEPLKERKSSKADVELSDIIARIEKPDKS